MTHKKLYKKDSTGNIRVWYIEQNNEKYRFYSGIDGGRLVTSEWTIVSSKNIGRSNETTPEKQASLEIESEYNKKIKKGYVYDVLDVNKKKFQCTLAKEYVKYIDKIDFSKQEWIAQTKFNGCRCIVTKNGAFTRSGEKLLTIDHILNEFNPIFEKYPDAVFDGELFNYDLREQLNELIKLVRKTVNIKLEDLEKSKQTVQYHVYDGFLTEENEKNEYFSRYGDVVEVISPLKYSFEVECVSIKSNENLNEFYNQQLNNKQEGIILRNANAIYEQKRSKNLLKYKPVDDDEAIIMNIKDGNGNWSNIAKTATINWNGKIFDATFLGSQAELKNVWNNKNKYLNKQIKFKYNGLTGLGIPNFARIDLKNSSALK